MKVLLQGKTNCAQNESGGVQVRIRKIHDLLNNAGVQADYFSTFETKMKDYDVLHIFALSPEHFGIVQYAKNLGMRIVLSSVINLNISLKKKIYYQLLKTKLTTSYKMEFEIINLCDVVIAETKAEAAYIHKWYDVPFSKIKVIPNGMEEMVEAGGEIYNIVGFKRPYVLQVGRFDANKNQKNVIEAVKGEDFDVVFVGGNAQHTGADFCGMRKKEAEGYANIHFTDWLVAGSLELASAYRNAHALILPSFDETFGLVAVEAASVGCHVCLSKTLPILDYEVFDRNLTFDPSSPNDIRRVLRFVMTMPKDNVVKDKVKDVFSWDRIIDEHLKCYSK